MEKVLVVYGDAAWLRCCGSAVVRKVVSQREDATQMVVELTSNITLTIVNGARCDAEDVGGGQRMMLTPLFQEPLKDNQYAQLCTFLNYCKRPSALRAWLVPYCVCCWVKELANENDAVVLPCKAKPPFHAVCKECASEKLTMESHCPYTRCLLASIPLRVLYMLRREQEEEEEESRKRPREEEEEEEEE